MGEGGGASARAVRLSSAMPCGFAICACLHRQMAELSAQSLTEKAHSGMLTLLSPNQKAKFNLAKPEPWEQAEAFFVSGCRVFGLRGSMFDLFTVQDFGDLQFPNRSDTKLGSTSREKWPEPGLSSFGIMSIVSI